MDLLREYLMAAPLTPERALSLPNAELRRIAIECMGPDIFFAGLKSTVIHTDTDGVGNRRRLLRVPLEDAERGYVQAVEVTCPTTGRIYHLGVEPDMITCQDAVASTFGLKGSEYQPIRET